MKKKLLSMCLGLLFCGSAMAQMQILYDKASLTTTTLTDGTTLVQFPEDVVFNTTDFQNKISVTVDGSSVANDAIVPNPATTFITENEIETFVYGGKAYSFRFTAGEYFTVVMFSDPHVDTETEQTEIAAKTAYLAAIGTEGGASYTFSSLPGYTPKADIVFCLGDMDEDKEQDADNPGDYFKGATAVFHNNGIPFITLAGNHDITTDYWDNGTEKGMTWGLNDGGQYYTEQSLDVVADVYNTAASDGGFTVTTIKGTSGADNEPGHFTFKYKGVRFYCANNYWWQKPWDSPSLVSDAKYYSAQSTVDALEDVVQENINDASIWLSHFPFKTSGSTPNERWWLDQNNTGNAILPSDGNALYYTSDAYTTDGETIADNKRGYVADVITQSKNPVHFSGHAHQFGVETITKGTSGKSFKDYTVDAIEEANAAYIVLCKSGVGVIEVKQITW